MVEVRQTDVFAEWFAACGIERLEPASRFASAASLSAIPVTSGRLAGVSEMRIDYGPGYRVYFVGRGDAVIVLLCAGDKRHQDRDIARALELARDV